MLYADGALGLILFGLWLFCLFDVITTDPSAMRHLPKIAWLLIVLVLFDLGAILWLVAGRNWQGGTASRPHSRAGARFPEYDRPGRAQAANPDDDEAFLRQLRERAEAQRRQYNERRKIELDEEQDRLTRRKDDDLP